MQPFTNDQRLRSKLEVLRSRFSNLFKNNKYTTSTKFNDQTSNH
jgi:hypothetical protein